VEKRMNEERIREKRVEKEIRRDRREQEERAFLEQVQECYQLELNTKLRLKEENERKIREMELFEQQLIERMHATLEKES
jgi:hypothetical protein